MKLSEFDYNLPKNLIAQYPSEKRDKSRLMIVNRKKNTIRHKKFKDIIDYLDSGDVLVVNKSKVIPARLLGHRITGGRVEVLLLGIPVNGKVSVLTKSNSKLNENEKIIFNTVNLEGKLVSVDKKVRKMQFSIEDDKKIMDLVCQAGKMPLPPYIKRKTEKSDCDRYQTVYADSEGSIASPTAGLHFTKKLLEKLKKKGVIISEVVLHVSYATFNPVREEDIEKHNMHEEYYELPKKTVKVINEVKQKGKRVIVVGTTSCRVLETIANKQKTEDREQKTDDPVEIRFHGAGRGPRKDLSADRQAFGQRGRQKTENRRPQRNRFLRGRQRTENLKPEACSLKLEACKGWTDLFIYPPYEFKLTDCLVTNFHFPKSTLLMLVSAFAGKDLIMKAYKEAIKQRYRFYSYGDCMLIL